MEKQNLQRLYHKQKLVISNFKVQLMLSLQLLIKDTMIITAIYHPNQITLKQVLKFKIS